MKTIFSIKHPELRVTLYADSVYATHPEDDNLYNKNEISMRELNTFSTNFTNGKEFYCDSVELLEIDNAGIRVNIYKDNKLVESEFYAIKRYNENTSNVYVNEEPFFLTKGFLY